MTDPLALRTLCMTSVMGVNLSQVAELFHAFEQDPSISLSALTQPSGVTGVVLLAESHLTIHTWPEKQSVTLDVYVCNYGQDNALKARALLASLLRAFVPQHQRVQEVLRGRPA